MSAYVRYIVDVDISTVMNLDTGERTEGVFTAKVYELFEKYAWPKKADPYQLLRSPDGTRDGAVLAAAAFISQREAARARVAQAGQEAREEPNTEEVRG